MNQPERAPESGAADPGASVKKPAFDQRTLDRIFGQVIPENTKDDIESSTVTGSDGDDWYRANRPPHHGG